MVIYYYIDGIFARIRLAINGSGALCIVRLPFDYEFFIRHGFAHN